MLVYQSKWLRAKGELVKTEHGVKIDFSSGIFTSNLGHDNHAVKMAVIEQLNKGFTTTYQHPTEIREVYLNKLQDVFKADNVLLFTTGAEACEAAYRIMRMFTGIDRVEVLEDGFHGKTMALLSGESNQTHELSHPSTDADQYSFFQVSSCGIMLEPYRPHDAAWYPCSWVVSMNAYRGHPPINGLICFDEIQAGFFRCGRLMGHYHYPVLPDLIVIGKSMANGIPVSAVIVRGLSLANFVEKNREKFSSTFGGNPISCAAGLAALEQYQDIDVDKLDANSNDMRDILGGVNGKGYCLALKVGELETEVVAAIFNAGVIVVPTGRGWIKIAPPITSRVKHLVHGCKVIKKVWEGICGFYQ